MTRRRNIPGYLRIPPPQELCSHCREWLSSEEILRDDLEDIPHCVNGFDFDCIFYMNGSCDTCPRYNPD